MIKYNILIIIALISFFNLNSQELPPIENYTPQEYGAENQNWAISQADSKNIYAANNKGLLEFNGASWTLYPSPNETILRSVLAVDNKVYTGAYMEFGFWKKNTKGIFEYTSLSKSKVNFIEDEQFWKIVTIDDYVVFQSLNRIYIYNSLLESFKIIESGSGIVKMYELGGAIYFQENNHNLYKIVDGQPKFILANESIGDTEIVNLFEKDGALLVLTTNKGFFKIFEGTVEPWNQFSTSSLSGITIYDSIKLMDGGFIIGSISNGIYHLSANGSLIFKIDQNKGLGDNTVLSIFEDTEQNIWLGLDNGIDCINMNSPFSLYNDDKGILGTVYASIIVNDHLYLGTNQGLFYKDKNSEDEFTLIKNTEGQVWSLQNIEGAFFCGHNKGTFIIKNYKATLISDVLGTWLIRPISGKPNLLLQGNYDGLNVLEKKDASWSLRNKIEGFDNSSKHFAFAGNNRILVNHEYKGVFNIEVDEDLRRIKNYYKDTSIQKGANSSLIKYKDKVVYAFEGGVYRYNENDKAFKKDSLLSGLLGSSSYTSGKLVFENRSNTLWGFSEKNISYALPGSVSNAPTIESIALPSSLRNHLTGYENISQIGSQQFLLGTSSGYIVINTATIPEKSYDISINSIYTSGLKSDHEAVDLSGDPAFKNTANNIEFNYSVAEFDKFLMAEYQYKLEGFNNEWSAWTTRPSQTFENLNYGDYKFFVRAKVGNSASSNTASFNFSIDRPWYLSNWVIALYILVFLICLFLTDAIYRKRREKMLQKTQRELEIKELENKQQLMSFENKSLQKDIDMKNKELAISTMSLIKKNEFLHGIKKELKEAEPKGGNLKPVIKIIDKNLNSSDDWAFFQEAFDNADKDFFKRIKAKHPKLTPNDLKLCAYLRLNLSSKEIAPLLNISHRSVEVKRYRLRKKIDLAREDSLTNHILEI